MFRLKGNIEVLESCSLKICSAVANRSKELGQVLQKDTQAFTQDRWGQNVSQVKSGRRRVGRFRNGKISQDKKSLRLLEKPAEALRDIQSTIGV